MCASLMWSLMNFTIMGPVFTQLILFESHYRIVMGLYYILKNFTSMSMSEISLEIFLTYLSLVSSFALS